MKGKIVKGIAGAYYISAENGSLYECFARGIFRSRGIKPLVGDNVSFDVIDEENKKGNVIEILERKSVLIRPPVANVDQAMILFAITYPNPSYNLLDRFLIMMRQQKLPVIICFNKSDIASKEQQEELSHAYENCGYSVLFISVNDNSGIDEIRNALRGKTTVIAGPSGVGKSSLINLLHPKAEMETGELSRKIARGKNTTRHSELFKVSDENIDTFIMDTPGFTSLYLKNVTLQELPLFYPEFDEYEFGCRFRGCAHISEPDCAVKKAVIDGKIPKVRYDNYVSLYEDIKNQKPIYNMKKR